jgi:UDP-N-acetylglucosamine--N-acetylmuramyl-(pentapeptide) pyrophosphoryl-undecaprenol N-acetylglucosamine transferase
MPLRRSITGLDRQGLRAQARQFFGLPPQGPVLLVFGGSLGARTLNTAVAAALPELLRAGIAVLHSHGKGGEPAAPARGYLGVPYIERMDLAYAAADAVLCRAGATTVAEVSAVGLPAVYVPLPHGNGEQRLNATPIAQRGGGLVIDDSDLSPDWIIQNVLPILRDPERVATMSEAAAAMGRRDADVALARKVLEIVGGRS